MKRRFLLLAIALFAFAPFALRAQTAAKHRVLFAVSSPDEADWQMALGNIRNLRAGLRPEPVQIEVVAFGGGIGFVKKGSAVEAEIKAAMAEDTVFLACENSMRHAKLTKADLIDGVGATPSGIVEVVRKQEQGWSYIKAGR